MAHVVTGRCVDCRYTYCVVECPVGCFWEIKDPHMLVIDPGTCIDCEACVPGVPDQRDLPRPRAARPSSPTGSRRTPTCSRAARTSPRVPTRSTTAKLLDEIQEEEQAKGWNIEEPSKAPTRGDPDCARPASLADAPRAGGA